MFAVTFALILLLVGGFIFTQGGKVLGPVIAAIGAVIVVIKLVV